MRAACCSVAVVLCLRRRLSACCSHPAKHACACGQPNFDTGFPSLPAVMCHGTAQPLTPPPLLPMSHCLQPSFDPGVESTPFMTWGDIEGTPLRIEAEDLPPGPLMDGGCRFGKLCRGYFCGVGRAFG